MNSHIRALKQHDDPAPLSCTRLGCQTMGVKVKSFTHVMPVPDPASRPHDTIKEFRKDLGNYLNRFFDEWDGIV